MINCKAYFQGLLIVRCVHIKYQYIILQSTDYRTPYDSIQPPTIEGYCCALTIVEFKLYT